MRITKLSQRGFTIIELLVSMVAFTSMVLLIGITTLQLGRMYYKGINSIETQEASRTILASVTEQVAFSSGSIVPASQVYSGVTVRSHCVGTTRYSYAVDMKLGRTNDLANKQMARVLWQDNFAGTCIPLDIVNITPSSGKELLSENMRIASFNVSSAGGSLANLEIGLVYGDNDLMRYDGSGNLAGCRFGVIGVEWCAESKLNTQVYRRYP